MGKDSIQIAVRVRPFASHEAGQTNIVKMDSRLSYIVLILLCCWLLWFLASSGKVTLTNPDDKTEKRLFLWLLLLESWQQARKKTIY